MSQTSPYTLLRGANSLDSTVTHVHTLGPSWSDLHALAAHWASLQARPTATTPHASAPEQPYIATTQTPSPAQQGASSAAPQSPTSPASRMRMPPPMHPPIAYPTGAHSYSMPGVPSTPPAPTRHANYDAIIQQHRNAAKKAVFVPASLG